MNHNRILLVFIITLIIATGIMYLNYRGSVTSSVLKPTTSDVTGQYAYNKTDGAYKGRIAGEQPCKAEPQTQCYQIEGELGIYEVPIKNILVKQNLR